MSLQCYDPFAEPSEQLFEPAQAFYQIEQEYRNNEVHHDFSADAFVRQAELLMLDAAFIGRFDAAQAIAARMHQLCGEDHGLNRAAQHSETFTSLIDMYKTDDGHTHNEDDDIDPKTGKKRKKKHR